MSADLAEIRAQDRAHVWHPLLQHQILDERELMVIEEGSGATLKDSTGKTYLDAYAGLWNVNVGYGREEIAETVAQQIQKLSFYPH